MNKQLHFERYVFDSNIPLMSSQQIKTGINNFVLLNNESLIVISKNQKYIENIDFVIVNWN